MAEQAERSKPGMRRASGRKGVAAKQLAAQFQKLRGRREPTQLDTVIIVLIVQKDAVGERLVGKVPSVGMLLVEITDAGKEPAGPQRQTPRQTGGLNKRFLDRKVVFRRDRQRQVAK